MTSRHVWSRTGVPPGRSVCLLCDASRQVFRSDQLAPECRSDEAGTTLFRAPGSDPGGWRVGPGPCVESSGGGPLFEYAARRAVASGWAAVAEATWARSS